MRRYASISFVEFSYYSKILDGFWAEPCTEIDFVGVNSRKRTIFWGSCKLDFQKHKALTLLAHVVSYFNNRGWDKHPYITYRHVFIFCSPVFQQQPDANSSGASSSGSSSSLGSSAYTSKAQSLNESLTAINAALRYGRTEELRELCTKHLSNQYENGAPLLWYVEWLQKQKDKNANKKGVTATANTAELIQNVCPHNAES